MTKLTRRDFVARTTAAAGAIALGCTDSSDPEPTEGSLDHIVVVTMDFWAQVQSYVMSQQYESLLKKANFKAT